MLNLNLSDNILCFVTFTFKVANTKWLPKCKENPVFSMFFSHEKAQLIISARFLLDIFFVVFFVKYNLYLTFKNKMFFIFTVTISIPLKVLTIV